MARLGIIFGLLLIGISMAAMLQTPQKAPSQFYSMMFGIPTFFCGIVALNPHRRRNAMLIAGLIAAVGCTAGAAWIFLNLSKSQLTKTANLDPSLLPIIGMTVVCGLFLCCCGFALKRLKKRTQSRRPSPNSP